MKLEFSLLIADDNPDSLGQAIEILRDYLNSKGFDLIVEELDNFSNQALQDITKRKGKNYDLVVIDYNLGQEHPDGAQVAQKLRQELPYTDMVFYSSNSTIDLLSRLAQRRVSGVFAETRDELDRALVKLADTVIGKAVDLNHMRGIAMAQVAEMDVMMEEALIFALKASNPKLSRVKERTKKKLVESMDDRITHLKDKVREGLIPIILDNNLFSSSDRYRAIVRMTKVMNTNLEKENNILQSYVQDIIKKRNLLAHAKEEASNDGQTVLRSTREGDVEIIDEDWMQDFRRKLRAHRQALETICEALRKEFDASVISQDSKEG